MYKIWSMKKEGDATAKKSNTSSAKLRVQRDITELDLPSTMSVNHPDPQNLLVFTLTIEPDEGIYKGGSFHFSFNINNNYPYEPPKVKCTEKIYHPNIDLEGNVCLNILREDWKPIFSLNGVMIGVQHLFLEPNPDDPLNKDAAEDFRSDRQGFTDRARKAMQGRTIQGVSYDRVVKN